MTYKDGDYLRSSAGTVYLYQNGQRRGIPNPAAFVAYRGPHSQVSDVSDAELNNIPAGPPMPAITQPLLHFPNGDVYFLIDGYLHSVPDRPTFDACGFQWGQVQNLPDATLLNDIPMGPPLPAITRSLLNFPNGDVYFLDHGYLHSVPDRPTFDAYGFQWGQVQNLTDTTLLDAVPIGPPLSPPTSSQALHADQTDDVGNGHHMGTNAVLTRGGQLHAETRTWSTNAAIGFHGGVVVLIGDAGENVIYQSEAHIYGVDGRLIPFGGPSSRTDVWIEDVGSGVTSQATSLHVVHTHNPQPNWEKIIAQMANIGMQVRAAIQLVSS
jgi:hypothetical protein